MEEGLKLIQKARPDETFVKEVLKYDVRTLEQTDSVYISKCVIALSQYIIYFKSKCNENKVLHSQKQRLLEATLFHLITPEIIKKYKTKKEARLGLVLTDPTLNKIQLELDVAQDEIYLVEGMDKTISELIASFKRELTRRDNELYQRRKS